MPAMRVWALLFAIAAVPAEAAGTIKTVFVIAMENHNWTQPGGGVTGKHQQLYGNPNAPFINSLVNGTASAMIDGVPTSISAQAAYATNYHNVLASPSGENPSIHPSEANYIWAEAGSNFGVASDSDPYKPSGGTSQTTVKHLSSYLLRSGKYWKSYQEDIDLAADGDGALTDAVLPRDKWTVPLASFSGMFRNVSASTNGGAQYSYAAKHNPQVFFQDTSGGNDPSPSNPLVAHYAPLQQLQIDLRNNAVAHYNWITPNQFNDMHTGRSGGYKGLTGESAKIRQGDDFLSRIVPMIMASHAYKDHGAIILWWDETVGNGERGDNPNDFQHTLPEIVISPDAHPNVNGKPYASAIPYTHSDDLRTMQDIFDLAGFGYLGDAANARGLDALFAPGAIRAHPAVVADTPGPLRR